MVGPWRYEVYNILTREFLASLPLYDVGFNTPLDGGGELDAKLTPGKLPDPVRRQLRAAIEHRAAWLFVYLGEQYIPWHGQIIAAPWSRATSTLTLKAEHSRTWLEYVHLALTRTRSYAWSGVDQLQIAREIVGAATMAGQGRVPMRVDATTSGVRRELNIPEQAFQVAADAIDSMAHRSGGFEWDILARDSSVDGKPELVFQTWYPARRSAGAPVHLLHQVEQDGRGHGNILDELNWPNDWSGARNSVFAVGDGEAPAIMTAYDIDPDVSANRSVRKESVLSLSGQGITRAATLADHAATERARLAHTVSTLSVPVLLEDPPITGYDVGDRFRLTYQDEWMDVDLPAVRCIDRTVRVDQRDGKDSVTLELDLSDTYQVGGA